MKLLLATNNKAKLAELQRIVAQMDIDILTLGDVEPYPEPVENERTFAGNALIKARAGVHHTGLPTLADDSGLCVTALNDMPGVLSSRWSGKDHSDQSNLELVLDQMAEVPPQQREAKFVSEVALVLPDGREFTTRGEMPGRLTDQPRGENGFGYDPIFIADAQPGDGKLTNGELDSEVKDSISHRGEALRKMARVISTLIEGDQP